MRVFWIKQQFLSVINNQEWTFVFQVALFHWNAIKGKKSKRNLLNENVWTVLIKRLDQSN